MALEENRYGMREIQRTLLRMAAEIDRVCRAHGIEYSLYGGTMLGAVREGGFIPWDDDLDMVFTAGELERFVSVFPRECREYTVTRTDTWVARVVPRGERDLSSPFVDLFHYEPISADKRLQRRKLLRLRLLQGMLKERIDYAQYAWKDRALVLGSHLLGLPFSKALKLRWYQNAACAQARGDGTLLQIADDCFAGLAHLYPGTCAERFEDILFEGMAFRVSAEKERMLRLKYGDGYMTPPPEAERRARHLAGGFAAARPERPRA